MNNVSDMNGVNRANNEKDVNKNENHESITAQDDMKDVKLFTLVCRDAKVMIPYSDIEKLPTVASAVKYFNCKDGYYINGNTKDVCDIIDKINIPLKEQLGLFEDVETKITSNDIEIPLYAQINDDTYPLFLYKDYSSCFQITFLYRRIVNTSMFDRTSLIGYKISVEEKRKTYSNNAYIRMLEILTKKYGEYSIHFSDNKTLTVEIPIKYSIGKIKDLIVDMLNKTYIKEKLAE